MYISTKIYLGNVRLSYSDNSQTLTDNGFESTTEGWGGNATVLSLENGKLKIDVTNQWAGAQKFLDVAPGDEIHYQMLLDKATTESLNLVFFEHDGSYVKLFGTTIAPNADGFISGSYTVSQGAKLRIKIEKGAGADTGIPTHYYLDNVKVVKKEIMIREEANYYPFGLKHWGYNGVVNGLPNKFFTYNGVGQEEALGLNVYEMDMRQYDPAIGRWIVMDPVVHHNMSPYNAFDNNPVFWADPSGADAESFVMDLFYRSGSGEKWTNNNDGTFSSNRGQNAECEDCNNTATSATGSTNWVTDVANTGSTTANNTGTQTSAAGEDPCPKCPDIEKRKLAIIMAEKYGGKAQKYYDALTNPDFVNDRISDNITWLGNISLLLGGASIAKWFKGLFTKKVATTTLTTTSVQFTKHSMKRLAERGVTPTMAKKAIEKGLKFYDPKNGTINYVLKNAYAGGKSLLVGTNSVTGQVTTVIKSSKNLIKNRFIPIN